MTDAAKARQQLADCIMMLERAGIIDYNGHCSIRLDDDRMLINIGSCQRSAMTPARSSIMIQSASCCLAFAVSVIVSSYQPV